MSGRVGSSRRSSFPVTPLGTPITGRKHLPAGNQKRFWRDPVTRRSAILARDWRFNSLPRADSLLKTRRETRSVRFIRVCRCVDIRQIDSARSNVCFAVRVCRVSRQKSVGSQD
jgi:hypothetical protein